MKTKNNIIKSGLMIVIGGLLIASQNYAQAQFGGLFGNKSVAGIGGATFDKDTFSKSSDDAAGKVLAARITFLDAKAKLMEALGLKNESMIKASEALRATEGDDSGEITKALGTQTQTTAGAEGTLNDALGQSQELSAESKAKFAEGGAKFIEGVLLEKDQIETIQKLVQQGQSLVQSAGLFQKMGVLSVVKPVTTMSAMVPGDVKEGTVTWFKILKFAQSQNIAIPGADKATEKLGGL